MTKWRTWKTKPTLRPDWEDRFSLWLELTYRQPHEWGQNDCLMQVAGAIEAQTGRDFAEGHRGAYSTEAESKEYLKGLGFRSTSDLLDSILDRVSLAFAQRGDIAMWKGTPGVIIGGEALFLAHEGSEPVRLPRSEWTRAWSVGRRLDEAGS